MTTTMLLEGLRAAAVMVRELGGQDMGLACLPRDAVEMLATLPGARMTATAYRGNAEGDYVIESVRVLVDGVTIDAQITPPRMATAEEVAALNGGRAREVGRSVLSVDLLTFRDQTRYHADQDDGAGGTLERGGVVLAVVP